MIERERQTVRDAGASFGFAIATGALVLAVIDDDGLGGSVVAATAGLAPLHLPCHFELR